MGMFFNPGNDGFQNMINGLYVDKTGLLRYVNRVISTNRKLMCISRPRRFGKSFAAKTLCAYYDRSCDSRELFSGLSIADSPDFEKHLNKYNVIYLDMSAYLNIMYDKTNILTYIQDVLLKELRQEYPDITPVDDSLLSMLIEIAVVTGVKFVFIIDEWDAIFREEKSNIPMQDEYIAFLRGLFKDSGRTDKFVAAAYLTGILPIKKYGTHSAMTDFQEFTILKPGSLKEFFGFTEKEVKSLFSTSPLEFSEAEQWYDGYVLGSNTHIYNPNSVIQALTFEEFGNYWTQTEAFTSLSMYIEMDFDGLKEAIMDMLSGKPCRINPIGFQNDMVTLRNKDEILTLLVHLGYLTFDSSNQTVTIPNEEIRLEFLYTIENGKHRELYKIIQNSERLLENTIAMNADEVAAAIQSAHSCGTAPTFYNNEQSLRSVIRFAYICCVDEYQEIQELPSGTGYADLVYIPKKNSGKPAMIIELKWNKTANAAISQIKSRNYPEALRDYTNDILLVGISYDEKSKEHTCVIELAEK